MGAPIHSVIDWSSSNYDMVIDVRAPTEFLSDHIPKAINMPVLSDIERDEVGRVYNQASPFEARKLGAAYISKNIANHLQCKLLKMGSDFQPLIYCWRGGQRSFAFNKILSEIGWRSFQLKGGYKTYRQDVIKGLEKSAKELSLVVVSGYTGSGKTKVLHALKSEGEQIIDLEQLACHSGSLLGKRPGQTQPAQKHFESKLFETIRSCLTSRKIYVEDESATIGNLTLPAPFWKKMKISPLIWLETPLESRANFLVQEYAHLNSNSHELESLLKLIVRRGNAQLAREISEDIKKCKWKSVATNLILGHYDPAYKKSIKRSKSKKVINIFQTNCSEKVIKSTVREIISKTSKEF